jgi:hypothetical protein
MPSNNEKQTVEEACKERNWDDNQIRTIIFIVEFYELSLSDIIVCGIIPPNDKSSSTRYLVEKLHRSWRAHKNPCGVTKSSIRSSSNTDADRKAITKEVKYSHDQLKGARQTKQRKENSAAVTMHTAKIESLARKIKEDMNGTSPAPATSTNVGEGSSKRLLESTTDKSRNSPPEQGTGKKQKQAVKDGNVPVKKLSNPEPKQPEISQRPAGRSHSPRHERRHD